VDYILAPDPVDLPGTQLVVRNDHFSLYKILPRS
jgi:hypothetical protein